MPARISVVVPVYNVAAYLEPCLDSLARQTFGDLEIIMVNDGSTDESADIAQRFADRDSRFRLVHQANAGLGAARNTGAAEAQGEFLAFADSDDVVPPDAYELLVGALSESGSDFAAGNVERLTSFGTTKVGFLARAFARTRLRTHITRFPPLLADRTAWNKLFRRSFWDRHGLRFPTGVFYEDTPVMLPAHYLARSVDVIEQTVYLWRMREGGDLSITQQRAETKTLRDRVAAVDHVSRFLAERRLDVSKAIYDRSVVGHDLRYFLDVLPNGNDDYRRLFMDLANEFIDRADKWVLDQPLAIDRLKWQLVRRRALPELLEVLRFEDEGLVEALPLREGRSWYGDYPYRTDNRLRIPRRVYRLEDEFASVFRIDDVRIEDGSLRIEGYAYLNILGAPRRDSQHVELFMRGPSSWNRRLHLETEAVRRPEVTASAAQQFASLDWSGFVAKVDLDRLKQRGRWRSGTWDIGVFIRAGEVTRRTRRAEPAPLHPPRLATGTLADGVHIRAGFSSGRLTVQLERRRPVVRSHLVDEGILQLEGDVGPVAADPLALELSRLGGARLEYPVFVDRASGRATFLARVPLEDLVPGDSTAAESQADGSQWAAHLAGGDVRKPLALDEAAPEGSWTVNGSEIALRRTPQGRMALAATSLRPVITHAEWSSAGSLLLEGAFQGRAGEWELVLSHDSRAETYDVELQADAKTGHFTAELTPGAVTSAAGTAPLAEGVWHLYVNRRGDPPRAAAGAVVSPNVRESLPLSAEIARKRFHFGVLEDAPVLAVERDLAGDERGGFNQRRLRSPFYLAAREQELRDVVLYDCFGGREYSDSPRAVHEELVRRGAPLEHLWIVRDAAYEVPGSAAPVRELSREYYELYARARYIVSNDHWPRWFERRADQISLQTWHGAPLKTNGYELAGRPRAVRAYRRTLAERPENWQYVVSPGAFATPILERAFPFGSEVLETGLPRTDLLLDDDRDRLAEEVKRRLGVAGKRIVLYAPTYRDQLDYRSGFRLNQLRDMPTYRTELLDRDGYRLAELLDLGALGRALGDDHVLLFRKHPRVLGVLPASAESFVRDVSDYPDATGLLAAADVLVTDYSSLIFDFASTRRPIILFTPDLERYRDEIRGFSIDLEKVAPGPLLRTTEGVVDALRDPEDVVAAYRERYDRFVESFCSLQDGRAAGRVVDRVFHW